MGEEIVCIEQFKDLGQMIEYIPNILLLNPTGNVRTAQSHPGIWASSERT